MKKSFVMSFAAATAIASGSAWAADMAPVYKAPPTPAAAVFNWTGFYVGGNIGGAWGRKELTERAASSLTHDLDISGVVGGGQVGANLQVGGVVLGVQGDWDWTNADGNHGNCGLFLNRTITCNAKATDLASVTGRVGLAWDRTLGYVKGGGAWIRDKYELDTIGGSAGLLTAKETRSGWTVGVGLEYAFAPNWTGFVEYDHYDFGHKNLVFGHTTTTGLTVPVDVDQRLNVVKVGINYLFNYGAR